jgi:hypothetical protein
MKTYGGVDVQTHNFLTSALIEGEWSASRHGRFTALGKSLRYLLDRRLGGPQRQCGRRGEEKNSWNYRDSNSDPSVVQPITRRYTDYAIPNLSSLCTESLIFTVYVIVVIINACCYSGWCWISDSLRQCFFFNFHCWRVVLVIKYFRGIIKT